MAIAVKENLDHYITKVEHRNGRIMTMKIKTKTQWKILVIINPHAPGMINAAETRKAYWNHTKQITQQTKKKDIVIWATDNNGQVSKNTEHRNNTIGKWTTAKENSKGNGAKLVKHCNNNRFVANTFFSPKKSKRRQPHNADQRNRNKQQANRLHRRLKWT